MSSQSAAAMAFNRDTPLQTVGRNGKSPRKRLHEIARGLHDQLDMAMEHRADPDHVSAEFDVRPQHAQHLFGQRTRRLIRQVQGDVRQLRAEVAAIYELLGKAA